MGSSIDCWIEYDELYDTPPFFHIPGVLPFVEWHHLRGAKDYPVYGALSGVRNETGLPPLYELRGFPPNLHPWIHKHFDGDPELAGWLHPSEVERALKHHSVTDEHISLEMRCVLNTLKFLAANLGDERVRFVFYID